MQLAIELSTRNLLLWAGGWRDFHSFEGDLTGACRAADSLSVTRRDKFPVDVRFVSNNRFSVLPDGAAGKLTLKAPGAWAGAVRATSDWERVGLYYRFFLNLDTVEIFELFFGEPALVNLVFEIEWAYSSGGYEFRQTSNPVPVVVSNDYIRDTDLLPVPAQDSKATEAEAIAGTSNTKWMSPLRVAQAIASAQIDPGTY